MSTAPARRIAYDCEFIENGTTIDLVSIGLVNVDDPTEFYYAVSCEFNVGAFLARDWLTRNVGPYLPWAEGTAHLDYDDPSVRLRAQIRDDVIAFITGGKPDADRDLVELWADYGAYDHVVLCWLWGGMAGQPDGVPMFTHDIEQRRRDLAVSDLDMPVQDGREHDALADALHTAACLRHLDDVRHDHEQLAGPWTHGDPGE